MTDILMPALSPTMEEGVLAKWIVKVGDAVHAGDIIAEIETDKATMEVEAVDDGVLTEILVPAGAEGVKVNTPIARLRAEGDPQTPSAPHAEEAQGPAKAADPAPAAAPEPDDVQISAPTPPKDAPVASEPPAKRDGETASRILASPLARRIAADRGLDLSRVEGTGPHGRIVKADVADLAQDTLQETLPAKKQAEAQAEAPAPRVAMTLEQMGVPPGSYDLLPLDGMRKTIARRMSESFRDVPHFPLTIDLEIDRLLDARGRLNHALSARGVKVSVNDFVIKACALALKAVPDANASYTPDGIALHHHADVAVAVAIEGGLITPIIRAAETRTLADISSAMKDLAERARNRKLKPEEFQGGTFSLSNLGMMGIKSFASIINEPQGCILSVGAGEKRPVVRDDQLAIATVMTATLTCDHRVVDGAIGARWLQTFKGLIEDPILMLA